METKKDPATVWGKTAEELLLGKTVVGVRYMTKEEMNASGWYGKALMIKLRGDDGQLIWIYPSADDEGNGPGALFTSDDTVGVLPVI